MKTRQRTGKTPLCYWRTRMIEKDCAGLRDEVVASGPVPGNGNDVCDCRSRFRWYLSPWKDYQRHLLHCSFLSCDEIEDRKEIVEEWEYRPLVSIILPVYKVDLRYLEECLASVEQQIYPNWELCAIDDGSGVPEIRERLKAFAVDHPGRTRLNLRDNNVGIAGTSQEGLDMACGEFCAFLDHDDRLAPEALFEMIRCLSVCPDIDWLYSDHDKISPEGERWFYHFKPDWSPDLLRSYNYILHFSMVRTEIVRRAGGFRPEFEGAQDYDLFLRLAEATGRVMHVPRVLYSWRQSPGSLAGAVDGKPEVYEKGCLALASSRCDGLPTETATLAADSWGGNYRVRFAVADSCVDVAVLDGPVSSKEGRGRSPRLRIDRVSQPAGDESGGMFLERILRESASPYLLIVDGVNWVDQAWPVELIERMGTSRIGAITPKIILGGKVDHCGLAFAPGGRILFPLRGCNGSEACFGAYGAVARNVSAVSPCAVLFNVSALKEAGGFDASMSDAGAVIAACFALRSRGFRVVADGGIVAELTAGPFDPGLSMLPGGVDFRQLTLRWPTMFCGGDPYYTRHQREEPADFGVRDERDYPQTKRTS